MNKGKLLAVTLAAVLMGAVACDGADGPDEAPMSGDPNRVTLTAEQVRSAGVRTQEVRLEAVAETRGVPAELASPDTASVTLGSVVEGRIEIVRVLPGDVVRAGQPLLEIHSHELTDALRDLRSAEARVAFAAGAAERSGALLEAGAVSREEVERRTAERAQAEAELERAREWVGHLSPSEDGRVVVRAPRDGTVFSVRASSGAAVLPGTELVSLGRTDVLWATGWVPERVGLAVRPGDPLELTLSALPGLRLQARVVQVGAMVDPVRRAVEVRVEVTDVPDGVRPGLFATMALPGGASVPRAILPESAVQRTTQGEVAFIEEAPGQYRPVPVSTVSLPDGRLGVTGLPEGQRVVVEGAYAVRSVMDGNFPSGGAS